MLCHVSGFHEGESARARPGNPSCLFFAFFSDGRWLRCLSVCLAETPRKGGPHRVVRRAGVRHPFAVSFFFFARKKVAKGGGGGGRWIAWAASAIAVGKTRPLALDGCSWTLRLSYGPARRRGAQLRG